MADPHVLPSRAATLLETFPELKMTVDGVLALGFVPDPAGPRAESTRRRDRAIRALAHRVCGDTLMERVDEVFLDEVRRGLFALGYSRDTVGRVRTLLRRTTRAWATGMGVPVRVDGRTAMGRPGGGPAPNRSAPTLGEVELLLAHLEVGWMRAVVALVVGCGVRFADLRDLRIHHATSRYLFLSVDGCLEVVVVPAWAQPHVQAYAERLETEGYLPRRRLLGAPRNQGKTARRLVTALHRAQRDAGLERLPPIGLRALRRTFISAAEAAGLPTITAPGRRQDLSDHLAVKARYERREGWAGTWESLTEPERAPRSVAPRAAGFRRAGGGLRGHARSDPGRGRGPRPTPTGLPLR